MLFRSYPEREVEGLRTGPPTTSWAVRLSSRRSLKRLTEVCTALEDPSTGPFGEAQDRLRAGAGVEDESCRLARTPFEEGLRQMIEGYRSLLPPFAKAQDSQREAGTCSRG